METVSSKQYSWNDISISAGGRIYEGCVEVEYTGKRETKPLLGRGDKAHRILRGNKLYDGKIVVWQSEYEAMVEDSPNKDITLLDFDIVWAFAPTDGGKPTIDIMKECVIKEHKKSMKQGDTHMLIELPFDFTELKPQQ